MAGLFVSLLGNVGIGGPGGEGGTGDVGEMGWENTHFDE